MKRTKTTLFLLFIPLVCLILSLRFRLELLLPLDILYVRAQNYNQRNMHSEMRQAYERLVNKYPERTELLYALGWAYYKTGEYQKAYSCMERYIAGNPYYPEWQTQYINSVRKASGHAL